jgi:hypothetical protein
MWKVAGVGQCAQFGRFNSRSSRLGLVDHLVLFPVDGRDPDRVSVELMADWRDHGPVRNGLPVMHYRVRVKRPATKLSEETRTDSPDEVRRIIYRAFEWDKD